MHVLKFIFLFLFILLLIYIEGCNNKRLISNNYFSIKIDPKWNLIEHDSTKYLFLRDTVSLTINIYKETKIHNILLRSPTEYIQTEDGNLLTNFVFLDSNTIYTSIDNLGFVQQTILQDSLNKNYKVKEVISPKVLRYLKVPDSNQSLKGIDFLGEFGYKNEIKWLPIKLPDYFKDFDFIMDITTLYYKKIYYPKLMKRGKFGFIYHSYKSNYTLVVQSSLVYASFALRSDIKEIINSIKILKK